MNKHLKGCMLIIASMIIYATIGIFVRYINLPNPVIIFFTSFFGFLILIGYAAYKRDIKSVVDVKQKAILAVSGALVSLTLVTYYMAYSLTTFANSVLTHYTAPIVAALLAPLLLKERLKKITVFSLILSFSGVVIIASARLSFGSPDARGLMFGIVSGISYGVLILLNKKLVSNIKAQTMITYQALVSMIFMSPFLFLTDFSLDSKTIFLLLLYTLFVFIGASLIYLRGLKHVKAQHAGIVSYAEPVFVLVFGFLFFKEIPAVRTYIGGLLILYSGYLVLRAKGRRR